MKQCTCILFIALLILFSIPQTHAAEKLILDTTGRWKMFQTLKPPVIAFDDGIKPFIKGTAWLDEATPDCPSGWTEPDFNDSNWYYTSAAATCSSPYLARICLRRRFLVTDPAKVNGLTITLMYHGGAAVYINGKEIARGHIPQGSITGETLAEAYPKNAFLDDKGVMVPGDWRIQKFPEHRKRRTRSIENISIPSSLLKKGTNLIAIEVIRAPYDKACKEVPNPKYKNAPVDMPWNTCEVQHIFLEAPATDGLVPNGVVSKKILMWNTSLLKRDSEHEFGDPAQPLEPVKISGVKNGSYTGKVMIGSAAPIKGLNVTPGSLKNGSAEIPASAVTVRYATYWDGTPFVGGGEQMLGALLEKPLPVFPLSKKGARPRSKRHYAPPKTCTVPIWFTIRTPKEIPAGLYKGTASVSAEGFSQDVEFELTVHDFTLPDPQDFQTWVELVQLPDTTQLEYGLEMWSDKHFNMMEKSFSYFKDIGSRTLYIPIICHTNIGNAEGMVHFIKKGNSYEFDFSVMERYLDIAEKNMGTPRLLIFNVWEIYLAQKEKWKAGGSMRQEVIDARNAMRGKGPVVTFKDPATGKRTSDHLPPFTDPKSKELWKNLFDELKKRIAKRGLEKTMVLGMINDYQPTKAEVEFFHEVTGGIPWASFSHAGRAGTIKPLYGITPVSYQAHVWVKLALYPVKPEETKGWKRPVNVVQYYRDRWIMGYPVTAWRQFTEMNIAGMQRGIGRIGGDFWYAVKNKRGKRAGPAWQRYTQSSWRNLDLYTSVLGAGKDGPISTTRLVVFHEGIQDSEIRIFLEQTLDDPGKKKKLGDLAAHIENLLAQRNRYMLLSVSTLGLSTSAPYYADYPTGRGPAKKGEPGHKFFVTSGWEQRTDELYKTAAAVLKKLK